MRGPNDKAGFARVVAATATPAARYDTPAFPSGSSTLVTRPVMSACPRSQVELSGNESANLAPSSDVLLPKKIRQTPDAARSFPKRTGGSSGSFIRTSYPAPAAAGPKDDGSSGP